MKLDGKKFVFSTGKTLEPVCGVIGLCRDGLITEGCDGTILSAVDDDDNDHYNLTPAEIIELADYMAQQWTALKVKHETPIFAQTIIKQPPVDYYGGKPVDELTHAEAIEAVKNLGGLYNQALQDRVDSIDIFHRLAP